MSHYKCIYCIYTLSIELFTYFLSWSLMTLNRYSGSQIFQWISISGYFMNANGESIITSYQNSVIWYYNAALCGRSLVCFCEQQHITKYQATQYVHVSVKPFKEDIWVEFVDGICMHFTEQHSPSIRCQCSQSGCEHCITAQATATPPSHRQVWHGSSGTKYSPTGMKRPSRSRHASDAPD